MKPIDWSRPVQTRDGRKVRVLCTDALGNYPVIGLVGEDQRIAKWMSDGKFRSFTTGHDSEDAINAPERVERILVLDRGERNTILTQYTVDHASRWPKHQKVRITYEGDKAVAVALEDAQ